MTTATKTKASPNKVSASDVADYFLALSNEAGDPMTNLRLQKLVYYAQAWHLANYEEPLFDEDFEAWVHGPVLPSLYRLYKERGFEPIDKKVRLNDLEGKFGKERLAFLREVADVYMPVNTSELEMMTHQEKPWIDARGGVDPAARCSNIISKDSMCEYYGERVGESKG